MAIDTSFFNAKELVCGVVVDASNVGTVGSATLTTIESDSLVFPTFNDIRVDRRSGSGSGIMNATANKYHQAEGGTVEVSVSGYMTEELYAILLPNVLGQALISSSITVDGSAKTNAHFHHGDTSGVEKTLTFAFNGVADGTQVDCALIRGCVITSLTLTADPNDDGGRMKFDLSAVSGIPHTLASAFTNTAATMPAMSANFVYLSEIDLFTKVHNADGLLKSFSMTIDNPVVYGGFNDTGSSLAGAPMAYIRSVPEMKITINPVIKYDTNFDGLWNLSRATTALTTPAFTMYDHATIGSATRFLEAADATLTNISWDEGDYLGLNIEMEVVGDTSTSFQIKVS